MDKYIVIITSFAFFEGLDENPIRQALKNHNNNALIKNIYVISESLKGELEHLFNGLDDLTIHFVEVKDRPTFNDLISYANTLLENDRTDYVALVNGDVSFENETAVNNAVGVLNKQSVLTNTVLALSRHEVIDGKAQMVLNLDNGLPNFMSADAWVFNKPCRLNSVAFYQMGQMNCDLMLAYDLVNSGYHVINSCLDTKITHHEDELKSDAFYSELNAKESNLNAGYKHLSSRVNLPYTQFGFPWVKSYWSELGYNPQPYKFIGAEAIWLVLNHNTSNSIDKNLLMATEIIAKASNRDLILLVEGDISDELINYYQSSLSINNRIYLISVNEVDNYVAGALSGEYIFYDAFVILSDLSRLSKAMLTDYSGVFVDLRKTESLEQLKILDKAGLGVDVNWHLAERYSNELFINTISVEQIDNTRKCSLISSVFKSDEFIDTFVSNCENLSSYEAIDHYYMVSNLSSIEKKTFFQVLSKHRNVIFVWHRKDPGLYECWNRGIKLAITKYVSNANVDDLRDCYHVEKLVGDLDANDKYSFIASALHPFYTFSGDLKLHQIEHPWYSDQQGDIKFRQLGFAEEDKQGQHSITPHNLPHCMPIWRKSLHDTYGYFDEATYGTFADWAFWLKITLDEEVGYLNGQGLGYYYVNLESHNRRGELLDAFHKRVEKEFLPHFLLSNKEYSQLHGQITPPLNDSEKENFDAIDQNVKPLIAKLNIHGIDLAYGEHRNSFNKLSESLLPLNSDSADGILFLPFIERYFVWGDQPGEASSSSPEPITQDWIGILHVPFDAPSWFHNNVSPENIFKSELWKLSLPYCRGLITLSDDLERDINHQLPELNTFSLKHPTEFGDLQHFNLDKFNESPTLVQAGDWLRNLQAIHKVEAPGYRKVMLKKSHTDLYLNNEIEVFGEYIDESVETYTMVPNHEYDDLLSNSVVVCWLYATAANNLILECIARQTPILINPLPSVVEYLGEHYPLYIDDLSEAKAILANKALIKEAHEYLSQNKFKDIYSYQRFFENFSQSEFYNEL
jgi:hypothetical protein